MHVQAAPPMPVVRVLGGLSVTWGDVRLTVPPGSRRLLATGRWWVMAAAFVLTVLTGLDYVYRALTLRQTSARAMQAAAARRAAGPTGASGARSDTAA